MDDEYPELKKLGWQLAVAALIGAVWYGAFVLELPWMIEFVRYLPAIILVGLPTLWILWVLWERRGQKTTGSDEPHHGMEL